MPNQPTANPLTLALAKGRISEEFFKAYSENVKAIKIESRKLIYTIDNLTLILVKPVDVPTYVTSGIADIGIVGRDVVMESGHTFFELNELNFSKCKMSIAGFDQEGPLPERMTIATKYPRICKQFFPKSETIYLNGSVELAPLMNLSDVIFDIVETGATLKENGLTVLKDVIDINPILIANETSYKFNQAAIESINNVLTQGGLNV